MPQGFLEVSRAPCDSSSPYRFLHCTSKIYLSGHLLFRSCSTKRLMIPEMWQAVASHNLHPDNDQGFLDKARMNGLSWFFEEAWFNGEPRLSGCSFE